MRKIVAVVGPTAVGKTKYSIEIAKAFDGEIVSCDSMQLYKYMDIGSAKPTEEERKQVKHHLVDFLDPRESFSVAQYQRLAKNAIEDIFSGGKLPVVTGGTGLYLNSLIYDMDFSEIPQNNTYRRELEIFAKSQGKQALHLLLADRDPDAAKAIHPNNVKKIIRALERINEGENKIKQFKDVCNETDDYEIILIGLTRNRDQLYDRINRRVDTLMEAGLADEVASLMDMGLTNDAVSMKGIGYKEIMDYFLGNCSREEAIYNVKKNTRHYAKKQLTWFRRYGRMKWYNISDFIDEDAALGEIQGWLKKKI